MLKKEIDFINNRHKNTVDKQCRFASFRLISFYFVSFGF